MEEVIRKYVDECWGFVQEHREYLMYVPSYEEHIEPEMQDTFDNIIPQGKSVKIYVTQPEHTNYMVDIITEKDVSTHCMALVYPISQLYLCTELKILFLWTLLIVF